MVDNLKTILKYIQIYTNCSNYDLEKIALLFTRYPLEKVKVKVIEKQVKQFVKKPNELEYWTINYLKENNITYEQLTENNRKYETVKQRFNFSKAAREKGFTLTDIGKKLKMHHSSIIHLVNHFKT
jgi:CHAT domain-containing protein